MNYHFAIKKNEIEPTWMDLEIVILREVSQTKKGNYHMISLIVESKKITKGYK